MGVDTVLPPGSAKPPMSKPSNPNTRRWQDLDRRHHVHPFTDFAALAAKNVRVITRAEGVYVWDSEGRKLLDGMSGLWCVNVGYGRQELADAARRQMMELPFYNSFFQTTTPPTAELAAKLAEITPEGLNLAMFCNSGSEANDSVVKLVRYFWNRKGEKNRKTIISRQFGYHGVTMAAASLSGLTPMHTQFDLPLPGFAHIEAPYWYAQGGKLSPDEFGRHAARALERKIQELGPENVAAFIGEPIQGAGGLIVPPDSYWPEIQRICRDYGILLVADEVICGFGRTGRWFGSDTFGIKPDLMVLAKGLSSGYVPIAAVMIGERVGEVITGAHEELVHGFTYSGHPAACAVALENIRVIEDEKLVERAGGSIGAYFQRRLREFASHPLIGEVRGTGLIAGMEMVADKETKRSFERKHDIGTMCRNHCFENGLVMRAVRDIMVLAPPLVIGEAEIDELMDKARHCLDLTLADVRRLGLL
jgi:putrescine aminotransferase